MDEVASGYRLWRRLLGMKKKNKREKCVFFHRLSQQPCRKVVGLILQRNSKTLRWAGTSPGCAGVGRARP